MGAWGTGYRDNDDYLDYREAFAEPLIAALRARFPEAKAGRYRDGSGGRKDAQSIAANDLRSQLMFTYKVLSAPDGDVALNQRQTDLLLEVATYVRQQGNTLKNPEFVAAINDEMDQVQNWLKTVASWS
jgi:hypothetical protein